LFPLISIGAVEDSLVVGMQLQNPPFEMVSTKGIPSGISVELAEALASSLDKKLVVRNFPFIGLIPALKNQEIECIISSMSMTKERMQSIDFSDPYIKTGLCLLISVKSTMKGIEDANQKQRVIAVKQGTTGEIWALGHLTEAKVLSLSEEAACVLEVVQGKADAFIYDQFSIYTHWKNNPDTTKAILKPFQMEEWAIGLRKDSPWKEKVNLFLKQFLESGKMEKILQRYFHGIPKE
jgi:polar amino acid transport system substrate-binding protein